MRIAQIAPLYEAVPPKLYGGTERVVANLCRGLTDLGHEVTLFASGDSETSARLVPCVDRALRLAGVPPADEAAYHVAQMADVLRHSYEFDVIHCHNDVHALALSMLCQTPVVTTLHGRIDGDSCRHALQRFPDSPLISISDQQRLPIPGLNWFATVHHGIPVEDFVFRAEPGSYLAFLGRISREKRPDLAIEIAFRSGIPIKLAAKIDPSDQDYYESAVKPHIDGRFVEFVGEIAEHEKSEFLGNALAMLFPIDWPEPFGLAPVEAWATGTPVLARPCGSVPELHVDGVTGYLRDSAEELAALIPSLETFDRSLCRSYAERRFSLHRMCKDYLDVYRRLGGLTRPERISEQAAYAACPVQPYKPDAGGRSLLHPVRRAATWHQQDRLERQ